MPPPKLRFWGLKSDLFRNWDLEFHFSTPKSALLRIFCFMADVELDGGFIRLFHQIILIDGSV